MVLTETDIAPAKASTVCHICKKHLKFVVQRRCVGNTDPCGMCMENEEARQNRTVFDHCHALGHFRGLAHSVCNLYLSIRPVHWRLVVYIHNFKSCDQNIIIKFEQKRHGKVRIIPTSIEKFLAMSVGRVLCLDSHQLMKASLEAMASEIADEDYHYTKKAFGSGEKFQMIMRKGVFPYSMLSQRKLLFPAKQIFSTSYPSNL